MHTKASESGKIGKYTVGTFIGEEWLFKKQWYERTESCFSKEQSCVLEITNKSFKQIGLHSGNWFTITYTVKCTLMCSQPHMNLTKIDR